MCVITQLPTSPRKSLPRHSESVLESQRFNVEFEAVLDNISWACAYNHEMQMDFLNQAE